MILQEGDGGLGYSTCAVSNAKQQPFNGNIFIKIIPMKANTASAYNMTLPLFWSRLQQAGKVYQRYAELASIGEIDPHVVIIEMNPNCLCFND